MNKITLFSALIPGQHFRLLTGADMVFTKMGDDAASDQNGRRHEIAANVRVSILQ